LDHPIDIVRYERGWFTSDAVTKTNWDDQTSVVVHHHITHGPYIGPGWATVESIPEFANVPTVTYFFGDRTPVTFNTRFAFDGSVVISAHSPAFTKPAPDGSAEKITWGGAQASATFGGD